MEERFPLAALTDPLIYWNAAAAQYAYIYGTLAAMNIDYLGMSQFVGYPTQFPRCAVCGRLARPFSWSLTA